MSQNPPENAVEVASHALFGMGVQSLQRKYGMNYAQASKIHADLAEISKIGRNSIEALLERFQTGEPSLKCVHAVSDLSEMFPLPNVELSPSRSASCSPSSVAVLFVRGDSVYHTMEVDAWDAERDATNYQGPASIVAHPPCRSWGCLRANAKPRPGEKELGPWAVEQVRKWGGVLEHPRASSLWPHCNLPRPGQGPDEFGGFTLDVDQHWWGHRAQKRTWLYVCGCRPADVPPMPITLTRAPCVITNTHGLRAGMPGYRKEVTKREREATPPALAAWLVSLAEVCRGNAGL